MYDTCIYFYYSFDSLCHSVFPSFDSMTNVALVIIASVTGDIDHRVWCISRIFCSISFPWDGIMSRRRRQIHHDFNEGLNREGQETRVGDQHAWQRRHASYRNIFVSSCWCVIANFLRWPSSFIRPREKWPPVVHASHITCTWRSTGCKSPEYLRNQIFLCAFQTSWPEAGIST